MSPAHPRAAAPGLGGRGGGATPPPDRPSGRATAPGRGRRGGGDRLAFPHPKHGRGPPPTGEARAPVPLRPARVPPKGAPRPDPGDPGSRRSDPSPGPFLGRGPAPNPLPQHTHTHQFPNSWKRFPESPRDDTPRLGVGGRHRGALAWSFGRGRPPPSPSSRPPHLPARLGHAHSPAHSSPARASRMVEAEGKGWRCTLCHAV